MKVYTILYSFFFLVLMSLSTIGFAQPGSTTEAEMNLQEKFIEGNREKFLGNYEKAIELYEAVLKKDRENVAVYYEIARVHDVLDQNDSALRAIKKAVSINGDNMWYKMFLADVHQKMEQNKEAASVYRDLVKSYPTNEYHYYKLAFFLVRANDNKEAIKVYDQMEKRFGLNEETIRRKHTLYVGLGDNKKAAKALQKLANSDPYNIDYQHLLAGFYDQIEDKEAAKKIYQKILALNPSDAKATFAMNNGKKNDDVIYLNTLKPIFMQENESIDVKIKALFPYLNKVVESEGRKMELTNATLDLAKILTQVHPVDPKAFSIYGDLFYHSGQLEEALTQYEKTLELDKSVFSVWEQMMYIHAERQDAAKLVSVSEEAMDLFPNKAKAYYLNGLANMDQANYRDAANALEQTLLMTSKQPELKLEVLTKLAISYSEMNKHERAKKKLDQATEMNGNNFRVHDAMAWYYYKQAKYDTAKEWLDKALAGGGENDPFIVEHYGDVSSQLGNSTKAVKYWKKAQELGNQSDALRQKISVGKVVN